MVVVSAAVLSKGGKMLCARQFVPIPKNKIDGYLAAFPKLIQTPTPSALSSPSFNQQVEAQHTFVETEAIRYVYQPLEQIQVLLITTLNSNIMEDLETLKLICRLIPEYCQGTTENDVRARVFELIAAIDECITHGGYAESSITQSLIKTYTTMDSHEEKLHKIIYESKIHDAKQMAKQKAEKLDQQRAEQRKLEKLTGQTSSRNASYKPIGNSFYDEAESEHQEQVPLHKSTAKKSTTAAPAAASNATKAKGMSLGAAKKGADDFMKQLGKEEKLTTVRGGAAAAFQQATSGGSLNAGPSNSKPVSVLIEEKLSVSLDREGEVKQVAMSGEVKVCVLDPEFAQLVIQTSNSLSEKDGFKCKLHPKLNKTSWLKDGSLQQTDLTRPFPVGDDNAAVLCRWKKTTQDEDAVPIKINFWHSPENGQSVVSLEYTAFDQPNIVFNNVTVRIPCTSSDAPEVTCGRGDYKFDSRNKKLTWNIGTIDTSDEESKNSTLEFSVSEVDSDSFFPISVDFDCETSLSGIQITSVKKAIDGQIGDDIDFATKVTVAIEKYEIESD